MAITAISTIAERLSDCVYGHWRVFVMKDRFKSKYMIAEGTHLH
jgi:hypothetical protein